MLKTIITSVAFGAAAWMTGGASAQTTPGITNIMVLADDADLDSVPASNDIHYRITAELREEMRQWGYEVLDTDAVLARIKWQEIPNRTSRLDKLKFVQAACSNGDATTCPRVVVFVKARASIESSPFGTVAAIRLQGDMVDATNLSALGNWQPVRDEFTAPSPCNASCRDDVIGDKAYDIAADLGDVLRIKLDETLNVKGSSYKPAPSADADIRTEYLITFRNFSSGEVLSMLDIMETQFPGRPDVGDHEGSRKAWKQNYSSLLDNTKLQRLLYSLLLDMNLSEDEFRITSREQRNIEIEKVIYGPGR